MTQRNKTIALALAGAGIVGALTVGHAVWAQTVEDPVATTTTPMAGRWANSRN